MSTDKDLFARLQADFVGRHASARDVWLVLEGDWGGQIYLTVPWRLVGPRAIICGAFRYLDAIAWPGNRQEGGNATLFGAAGTRSVMGVPGGMGGGQLLAGLWMHEEFTVRDCLRVSSYLDLPGSRPPRS